MDELSVAVPTKGIKYIFPCKCWLAKDRGDGLTARLFNVLDSSTINIIRKVSPDKCVCLCVCTRGRARAENIQFAIKSLHVSVVNCVSPCVFVLGSLFGHGCHR